MQKLVWKKIRNGLALTQEDFGYILGAHKRTVSAWECNRAKPTDFQQLIMKKIGQHEVPNGTKELVFMALQRKDPIDALRVLLNWGESKKRNTNPKRSIRQH